MQLFIFNLIISKAYETNSDCFCIVVPDRTIFSVFPELFLFFISLVGLLFSIVQGNFVGGRGARNAALPPTDTLEGQNRLLSFIFTYLLDPTKYTTFFTSFPFDLKKFQQKFYLNYLICCYFFVFMLYVDAACTLPGSLSIILLNHNIFNNKALIFVKMFITFLVFFLLILIRFSVVKIKNINHIFYFNSNYFTPEILFILSTNVVLSLLLVTVFNYFTLVLFFQGLSITQYFLLAQVSTKRAAHSTLRYFIFGSWILCLLIFSTFLFYYAFQSFNLGCFRTKIFELFFVGDVLFFSKLGELDFLQYVVLLGVFSLFFSLFFKLGTAPFHFWTVNICETVPRPVILLLMVVNKLAIFVLLFRLVFFVFFDLSFYWKPFFLFFGLLSIVYSSVLMVKVERIKTLASLLFIQSTGFVLIILSCYEYGSEVNNTLLWSNAFQYLVLSSLCWFLFFFLWLFSENYLKFFLNESSSSIAMLSDFSKIGFVFVFFEPIILFLFTLVLLNIVGFPPFIIFFVKYTVFMLVLNTYGYFVAALLLIFSIFPIFKSFDVLRQLWLFYFPESFKKQQGDLLDLFSADFVESLSRKFKFLLFQKFKDGLSIRNFFFRVDVVILILFKRYIKFFFNFIFLHVFGGSLTNKEVFSDDSFASSTVSLKFVFKSNKLIIYFLSILFVFIILNPAKFQELSLYFANLFAATWS